MVKGYLPRSADVCRLGQSDPDLIRSLFNLMQSQLACLFGFVASVDNYALESDAVHSHLPTDIDGAASMSRIVPK